MARPTRIVRMVVDRTGGAPFGVPVFDLFSEAEFRSFHDHVEDWVERVIDAIEDAGYYEEGDEEYLILFFDATALERIPR
jgi:hypothetical protein